MDCSPSGDLAAETQAPDLSSGLFEAEGGQTAANDAYWRSEVAARLERYRSRRKPRAPRYPTLRLPFDSAGNYSFSATAAATRVSTELACHSPQNLPPHPQELDDDKPVLTPAPDPLPPLAGPDLTDPPAREVPVEYETSNLIEFPRSAVIPIFSGNELAEPVLDRPRIVEAPEVIPPPPALGGILMEPAPIRQPEKRAGDFVRQPASLARRLAAGAMDVLILMVPLAGCAEIFHRINPERVPIPLIAGGLLAAAGMLWLAYKFLFVVYTGSTPGWRIARLRLANFDGSPVRRGLRGWRVLASFLSAFSIGLGYLWSVLDEDGLCWHDRITHTYLESSIPRK